jgi:hypothetical protein
MARKRHSDEDVLKILREIQLHLASNCSEFCLDITSFPEGLVTEVTLISSLL